MQSIAHWYGNGCNCRCNIHDGVHTMNRDKQEQNTKYFYIALAMIGVVVLIAQAFIYLGYMIGEWMA